MSSLAAARARIGGRLLAWRLGWSSLRRWWQGGGGEFISYCAAKIVPLAATHHPWMRRARRMRKAATVLQSQMELYPAALSAILSTTSFPLAVPCLPALTLCHRPWEPLTIDLQRSRSPHSRPSPADPLPPLLHAACPCPFCALFAHLAGTRRSCTDILRPLPSDGVGPPSSMMELAA